MMSTLRSGAAVTLFGLVLLAVAIWWYAPYLGLGSWYPLQGIAARLILIAVIFVSWGVVILFKKRKAAKACLLALHPWEHGVFCSNKTKSHCNVRSNPRFHRTHAHVH